MAVVITFVVIEALTAKREHQLMCIKVLGYLSVLSYTNNSLFPPLWPEALCGSADPLDSRFIIGVPVHLKARACMRSMARWFESPQTKFFALAPLSGRLFTDYHHTREGGKQHHDFETSRELQSVQRCAFGLIGPRTKAWCSGTLGL